MKKLEIMVSGDQEEAMGRELLDSIDKVIRNYEGMEVSVQADTITGSTVQNFVFWSRKPGRREGRKLHGR